MNYERNYFIALAIYVLAFIGTYGHAFKHGQCEAYLSVSECAESKAVDSFMVAMFWPLYVSKELWK